MKTPEIQIMPSLLAAHPGRQEEGCIRALEAGADQLHLDVMDGHFVPNISFGPAVVAMARKVFDQPLDVHLMLTRPDQFVKPFAEAGSDSLLIHIEAECDVPATLKDIREAGMLPGIVLNPGTDADAVFEVLDAGLADQVLCMTVWPGFGGQKFIQDVLPKIKVLRDRYPELDVSVDGGVDRDTALLAGAQGANLFVMGTSLYKQEDMKAEIDHVRSALQNLGSMT